jgi:alcohol dehydrogenase
LRFNAESAATLYAELADVVVPGVTGSAESKTNALIGKLEQMIAATAIPARLRDVGIEREGLPRMASDAMLQTRLLVNNPRPVAEEDALAIYTAAF